MSTNKDKERAFSLTGNTIATTVMSTVQAKNTYFKIKVPDTFSGDRKKFKVYEIQYRMYL
jgi:hypothetical protein